MKRVEVMGLVLTFVFAFTLVFAASVHTYPCVKCPYPSDPCCVIPGGPGCTDGLGGFFWHRLAQQCICEVNINCPPCDKSPVCH